MEEIKNAKFWIDDLNALAHHASQTGQNIEFTADQIKAVKQIIIDLIQKING